MRSAGSCFRRTGVQGRGDFLGSTGSGCFCGRCKWHCPAGTVSKWTAASRDVRPWIPSSWAGSKQKLESVSQVSETGSCQIQKVSNSFPSYNSAALIPPWRIRRVFQRAAGRCRIPLCSGYKPGLLRARPSQGCFSLQNWSNC